MSSPFQDIVTTKLPNSWTTVPAKSAVIEVSPLTNPIEEIIENGEQRPTVLFTRATLTPLPTPAPEKSLDAISSYVHDNQLVRLGKYQTHWSGILTPIREAVIVSILLFLILQSIFVFTGGTTFKNLLFKQTFAGLDELKQAKNFVTAADFQSTISHFLAAQSAFVSAHDSLQTINHGQSVLGSSLITTSNQLLSIGENLSSVGNEMTAGVQILLGTANWKLALPAFKKAANQLRIASLTIKNIDTTTLPGEYQEKFKQIKTDLPLLDQYLALFDQVSPALLNFTADKSTKRYLVVLQNTSERRGTGGFMGSFIEVSFQNGKLLSAIPKDVYTVDWQQFNRKAAPDSLQPYMKGLALRDSNYNPDFYQASEDIRWAYSESRQGSIDGVIAIDQSLAPELLKIIGPITLPDFQVTLTPENYFTVLQYYIETNKNDPETPKRILLEFVKQALQKLAKPQTILSLSQFAPQMIAEKHVQVAMFDPAIEKVVQQYGLDGTLLTPENNLDYLNINAINVGGNKGDRLLTRNYQHTVSIDNDGSLSVHLQGNWQHHWSDAETNSIRSLFPSVDDLPRKIRENFWHVIGNSPTKHIVRFFVPKGSTLLNNTGFNYPLKSSEENGYQVWYSEVDVAIGGQSTFDLSYKLPYKLNLISGDNYRFLVQKQAGAEQEQITHTVTLADQVSPIADYPGNHSQGGNMLTTTTDLNTDRYFEILVRKK